MSCPEGWGSCACPCIRAKVKHFQLPVRPRQLHLPSDKLRVPGLAWGGKGGALTDRCPGNTPSADRAVAGPAWGRPRAAAAWGAVAAARRPAAAPVPPPWKSQHITSRAPDNVYCHQMHTRQQQESVSWSIQAGSGVYLASDTHHPHFPLPRPFPWGSCDPALRRPPVHR